MDTASSRVQQVRPRDAILAPSEQIELAIYHSVEFSRSGDWRPYSWGELSTDTGRPLDARLVDALKRLHGQGRLGIRKWVGSVFVEYRRSDSDERFFFTGDFQLAVTPEGRPYFENLDEQWNQSVIAVQPSSSHGTPYSHMNLTSEQRELLNTIVGVYNAGCQTEFIVSHTQTGSSLIYSGHPAVSINAGDSDFQQLEKLNLISLTRNSQGSLRGKTTGDGIRYLESLSSGSQSQPVQGKRVFIGHGHSTAWLRLKDFLVDRLKLHFEEFNRAPVAGYSTQERLSEMLDNCGFAFIVLTAEDERADGTVHARENVIHEAGLFQGRLGFKRAIILLEHGCTQFSNIHGLTYIPFPPGDIIAKSEDIRRVLEREGMLKP